tara:strand:+ start:250 stop:828 length:579 start_codon:yes stop_codon:yes gene_type:complete
MKSNKTNNHALPDNIVVDVKVSPTGRNIDKQRVFAERYGMSGRMLSTRFPVDIAKANKLMEELSTRFPVDIAKANPCSEIFLNTDMSKLEDRIAASTDIPTSMLFNKPKEKSMKQSLTINRPVLIGTTDILTAQTFELDAIIREANTQIDNNADLCAVSEYHKQEKVRLEEVISLCVAQLDKGLKAKESLVS